MPSEASRSEVERLHRLMIEASIELAALEQRLADAQAAERLWPELRVWVESAQALGEAVGQARSGLQEEGTPAERIERILRRLADLQQRSAQFDLEFDLDDCADSWDAVREELFQVAGSHREALLRLLRGLEPAIDAATAALFDARKAGFLEQQRRTVAALAQERDRARERFERLRQAWLDALRALEEAEAPAVVIAPPLRHPPPQPAAPPIELELPPPEPVLALPPELQALSVELELPPPPEPETPREPELTLPPEPEAPRVEPELELPPPEPETPPEPELALPPEPGSQPEPEPLEAEPELPPPPEFVRLPERKPEEERPPTPVVVKPPPLPPPPKPAQERPGEKPELPAPKFVRAPQHEPPEKPPGRPLIVKRAPLPPPPAMKVEKPPPPDLPEPAAAPERPAPPRPFFRGIEVERVERAGLFPAGPDGIGLGNQTATIWFRAGDLREPLPIAGSAAIALGCETRLEVMPSVRLFSATPGRPVRGTVSLFLVSSGGHLSGAQPKKAQAEARASALAGAAQIAASLGTLGRALQGPLREMIADAAAKIFARALPGADGGKLRLERELARRRRRDDPIAARLERMLSLLASAERKARLVVRNRMEAAPPEPAGDPAGRPAPVAEHADPVGELIDGILGADDGRIHADRGAARDYLYPDDDQEMDASAPDTWIGSGEGVKIFSDVFAPFIPAEGARIARPPRGGGQPAQPGRGTNGVRGGKGSGFFATLFDDLEQFADRVGGWAKKGSRLFGKGMHASELGMHRLAQVEGAAEQVRSFASGAEAFLEKIGLHRLAEAAERAGAAAEWTGEKAHAVHGDLTAADGWMAGGRKETEAARHGARAAAAAFGEAAKGKFGPLVELFRAPKHGDGIDGRLTPDKVAMGPILDEPKRLDVTTLSRMEAFLGDDFSGVRIHTGPAAAEVTRRFGAEAVTVRDHIFFAPGRFSPASLEGEKLIAHELTHVLQRERRNLDVRTAESEALRSEHGYGQGPSMETLNLGRPAPDFRLAAEGEGMPAPAGIHTAKRTRSRGHEVGGKDTLPDGEELLEQVSARVYELLLEELEHAFESR